MKKKMTQLKLKPNYITLTSEQRLYHTTVPLIGLTGGIASGKTTVCEEFKKQGLSIINADHLIKEIYQKPETIAFISTTCPQAINNHKIDFKTLRKFAFEKPKNRELLESFLYQHMPEAFKRAVAQAPQAQLHIYDVPLLFEKNLAPRVDHKICVYSPREVQVKRLLERDSIDLPLAEKILSEQWPIEKKKEKSDSVISNESSLMVLKQNIRVWIKEHLEE